MLERVVVSALLAGLAFLGSSALAQQGQVGVTGPSALGWCEQGSFTITFTNNGPEEACEIVVTSTRPNAGFSYVAGTSEVTLPNGEHYYADPQEAGLDLIWAIDGIVQSPPYKLPPGESLTVRFDLATSCDAISGTDQVRVDFRDCASGSPGQATDSMSVEVLPGAVTISKEPAVISARVGDEVTWTIAVESTGLGPIHNVVVTDALGPGLAYVSSSPPGSNLGQTVIWDKTNIPALAGMEPGEKVEIGLTARVAACAGLENKADARFGCDGQTCYDTALQGGTATGSILLLLGQPLLDFTPPAIALPYCEPAGTTVAIPVTSTGDGNAREVRICVDFSPLVVSNVQGGASYDGSCFHLTDLGPGESFDLAFDLSYPGDWCAGASSGRLFYQSIYLNDCGEEFRPPVAFGSYSTDYGPQGPPAVSASISGPVEVDILTSATYHVSAGASGLSSCDGGSTSDVQVTMDVPAGFTVEDSGGGTWTPGGDGTGGTITWVIPASGPPLDVDVILTVPAVAYCYTTATASLTARGTDCCGCEKTASSSTTTAIQCRELVGSQKAASPSSAEKCAEFNYTNTYSFAAGVVLDEITFGDLVFTEYADNEQQYMPGTISITIDGSPATATIIDTTPGGTLQVKAIDGTWGGTPVWGHTLVISYQLEVTAGSQPSSCPGSESFYSWSSLDLGPDCDPDQLGECVKYDALLVEATTPAMAVGLTGLAAMIDECGTYPVTITLTKTRGTPGNVRLQVANLNYYIVDLSSIVCSGDVLPPDCNSPADFGTYYEWSYGDLFAAAPDGARSVITAELRKRCDRGLDLTATALFEDLCGGSCAVGATNTPSLMRTANLFVYKTPEVVYATRNQVSWTIYVVNSGSGWAYDVSVDDLLGSGLAYADSTVTPSGGVTTNPNQDHTGAPINGVSWLIAAMAPGETRTIGLTADLVTCAGLTDEVRTSCGCGGEDCRPPASDSSRVLIPTPNVVSTSYTASPIDMCATQPATLTIKNAGDSAVYELEASETLPSGISYVPGSTQWRKGSAPWTPGSDPAIAGSTLTWTRDEISGLAELRARETIETQFGIRAGCAFAGGNLSAQTVYRNVCGALYSSAAGGFYLGVRLPSISVSKAQVEPSAGQPADCNDPSNRVTWRIDVTNTGAAADWVRLEDTIGPSLEYVSSDPSATPMGGQKWGWEFGPLAQGETRSFYLTARLLQPNNDCSSALRTETAQAAWGCGPFDGDPNTSGEHTCEGGILAQGTARAAIPDLTLSPSDIMPSLTCAADGNYSGLVRVRIRNNGDGPVTKDFLLTLTESTTGWTVSGSFTGLGGTLPINAGSSRTITIPGWPVSCAHCNYSFAVTLDTASEVCECRENNNSTSRSYTITIPDIEVSAEALSVTCLDDGQSLVSGTVTLANSGCGSALTANIPVRFTLYSVPSCGGSQLDQWAQTFTGVNIPAGGSQTFTIAPHTINADLCQLAANCGVSLNVEADYTGSICECDGTNNARCSATKQITYPDLAVTDIDFSGVSCVGDGISGSVAVMVENRGCGPAGPFAVRLLTDGCLSFADQTVPGLAAGASTTVTFPITGPWADCADCSCTFTATVDPLNQTCECSSANSYSETYTSSLPDLRVTAAVPDVPDACTKGTVLVTVENAGCGTAPAGTVVRITGGATGEAVTTVPLGHGESQTLKVKLDEVLACGDYQVTATADPDGQVCECNGQNQARAASFSVVDPDLSLLAFSAVCNGDDTFTITAEIRNLGGEAAQSATIRVYADGNLIYSKVRDIPAGGAYHLEFTTVPLKCGITHAFRLVLDEEGAICECNEANNVAETSAACPCPALVTDKEILELRRGGGPISPDQPVEPGDIVSYRLTVTNVGQGRAFDVDLSDTLPVEFAYLPGTTQAVWPSGSSTADPAGAPGPDLFFDLSAELAPGEALALTFQAAVTSAVEELKSYTDRMCATGREGNNDPIPPDNSTLVPQDTDPDDCSSAVHPAAVPALVTEKAVTAIERRGQPAEQPLLPGDIITFELMVRNVGSGTAYNVELTDLLPQGFAYIPGSTSASWPSGSSTADPAIAGQALTWALGATLHAGEALTLSFSASVLEDVLPGFHDNVMQARGNDGAGNPILPDRGKDVPADTDPDDSSSVTLLVAMPALVTEKAVVGITRAGQAVGVNPPVEPGETVTFRLTVTNVGNAPAYDVNLTDVLPEGFAYLSGTTFAEWPGGFYTLDPLGAPGPLLSWAVGATLRPGETLVLTFEATVTAAVRDGETYCDVMRATGVDVTGRAIPPDQSWYIPDDIDPDDSSAACLPAHIPMAPAGLPCEKAHAVAEPVWFQTDIAMFAASEFQLLAASPKLWPFRLETLLPSWVRTAQAEAREYAIANLIQVSVASQVGIALASGPRILERAEERGLAPEAALEEGLSSYAQLVGLAPGERPENERWVFVEFAGGDPRYRERSDDLWPGGAWPAYDRRILPSALGMSLVKQVMEARARLGTGRPLDRYLALVLTEAMVNKLLLLDRELALELPEKGIRYFAHAYEPRFDGQGRPVAYEPTDRSSQLFDQLTLLWGLAEFVAWSDPAGNELFGAGQLFPAELHEQALKLGKEVLAAILALHRDGEGRLWDLYNPGMEPARTSSTVSLGLLLVALERAHAMILPEAAPLIPALGEALLARRLPSGGFADELTPGGLGPAQSLAAQLAAVRGLLVAYQLTSDKRYLEAAEGAFAYLESSFWDERLGLYAAWTDGRERRYCYTPLEVGLLVGAFRELARVSERERAELILERLGRSFRAVVDAAALQLSQALTLTGATAERSCEIFHGNGFGEIAPLVVIESPWGVAPVLQQRLCLDLTVSDEPCLGLSAEPEPWFQTDIAMYAAYEMEEVAPWAEDYADSNLTNLVLYSGMGLPLDGAEVQRYAAEAGLEEPPEVRPLALEFYSGSLRLRDPTSRRWDEGTFDERLVGSAIGMTLLREAQEAAELLEAGREPVERFYGFVLLGAIERKLAFLEEVAQERLGATGRAYIPHAVGAALREGRLAYEVLDPGSELFDQLALLWGLSEAYSLARDRQFEALFGPDKPEVVARLAAQVLDNLLELHLDEGLGGLVDRAEFSPSGWRRGDEVTTANLGLAVAALESAIEKMADLPAIRERALDLMRKEVEFLIRRLADGRGGYFDSYSILAGRPEIERPRGLASQLAAIRALLAAYRSLGEPGYLSLAQEAFDSLERFWQAMIASCAGLECYSNPLGEQRSCYTPLELGLAVGALERLTDLSERERAVFIRGRLGAFFDRVADGAKMQLPPTMWWQSSGAGAGAGAPSGFFAEVLARRVCLRPVEGTAGQPVAVLAGSAGTAPDSTDQPYSFGSNGGERYGGERGSSESRGPVLLVIMGLLAVYLHLLSARKM
ncbi:MAG: CARDB domain-containing protein [Candidatus Acetothermia bacterium]|nr:CARDB domain-containing protein [Candidatus Acetothermia bacterium]